ncbi:hypothetical protein MC7420_8118 [Coleofasciculus chthonoplastes PCC 7420]|uniref:Uncharacterized protein n=1 Tax=Coleofasciculus chthonoplastes PCC 7420 TaxID=118168 RepID=B4W4I6_9CYAN|nr:hypothetical protein MC7420_8118 [Coleofasciculus chthonoplastes PCC 7420]
MFFFTIAYCLLQESLARSAIAFIVSTYLPQRESAQGSLCLSAGYLTLLLKVASIISSSDYP